MMFVVSMCCFVVLILLAVFSRSILPILVFPSGNGQACPPFAQLRMLRECSVNMTDPCNGCDGALSSHSCGVNSGCGLCNQGQSCSSDADCSSGLTCSSASTCIRKCGVVILFIRILWCKRSVFCCMFLQPRLLLRPLCSTRFLWFSPACPEERSPVLLYPTL